MDDPISSFDYDKRYGILYALFSKSSGVFNKNLSGETVLLMTHDLLVVADIFGIPGIVSGKNAAGSFLSCDAEGALSCVPLGQDPMAPYTQILRRRIRGSSSSCLLVRLVYVRQLCELQRRNAKEKKSRDAWTFKLLSGIVHAKSEEEVLRDCGSAERAARWVAACEGYVEELTGIRMDFWETLRIWRNGMPLLISEYRRPGVSSGEKLVLVRLMAMRDAAIVQDSAIMKRFLDETCHIGGSYLYQLDGDEFDQIPFYVTEWCDAAVDAVAARLGIGLSGDTTANV